MTDDPHPPARRITLILVLVIALTGLVMQGSLSRVPVTVNGVRVAVPHGATLGDALRRTGLAPEAGDLLSAANGRVVREKDGLPGHVNINGAIVDLGMSIEAGDRIYVVHGADVIEPIVEVTAVLPAPIETRGQGARLVVLCEGEPGSELRRVGSVSGDIVSSRCVKPPQPMVLRCVNGDGTKLVALTFDDGPWPGATDQVLRVLDDHDVTATFFMLGINIKKWPEVARRVGEAGHPVGNHTYRHEVLTDVDQARLETELLWTTGLIEQTVGNRPIWFRPPGGLLNGAVYAELQRQNLKPVLWTVDPQDWEGASASEITQRVIAGVHPGAVVLLHDGGGSRDETVKALPVIIEQLQAKGYTFVSLDELDAPKSGW
jgi:peptidoglycan/xylan/chitin deacetylase (PgdA/CDA1 family)/sulfur carrier protein ThiS